MSKVYVYIVSDECGIVCTQLGQLTTTDICQLLVCLLSALPLQKFAQLARDLAAAKERIAEKEEEVQELKAERANTRVRQIWSWPTALLTPSLPSSYFLNTWSVWLHDTNAPSV